MMDVTHNVRAAIQEALQSILERPVELEPEMNIVADFGMDSMAIMDFCMALEDRFDVSIPLDKMAEIESVQDLSRTIETLLAKG
ncbi:acyl carrier protein [Manganibacter manganicus]|uniref:Acyl carrier protein n=1 Tax=Manganibacter manganicus TaxID=1873176 RepID=A0A1V8RMK1_9HYPH|nr:acyl carrier protein [Pseudaminobacter manganicus]OQM74431.1 acyl carrier protein [Pseudaminobacter manganicus]